MFCHDFIRYFEEQNPGQKWSKIEGRIITMLGELLKGSVKEGVPSIVHNPQSRAMYAVDLMLSWTDRVLGMQKCFAVRYCQPFKKKLMSLDGDETGPSIQPKLLEMNWAPDCKRACAYYPEFFDDVFSILFLDETEGKHVRPIF